MLLWFISYFKNPGWKWLKKLEIPAHVWIQHRLKIAKRSSVWTSPQIDLTKDIQENNSSWESVPFVKIPSFT